MKLVTYDSIKFIMEASSEAEAVATAMESNLAFLEAWKDNPPDDRYEEYVTWAKLTENYSVEDLDLETLDNLLRCAKDLYVGKYGDALVFNE